MERKPERRQEKSTSDSKNDKYGNPTAPKGSIVMTMKMIDDMAESVKWAGQAPITRMMSEFYKEVTGKDLGAVGGGNGTDADAALRIVV